MADKCIFICLPYSPFPNLGCLSNVQQLYLIKLYLMGLYYSLSYRNVSYQNGLYRMGMYQIALDCFLVY